MSGAVGWAGTAPAELSWPSQLLQFVFLQRAAQHGGPETVCMQALQDILRAEWGPPRGKGDGLLRRDAGQRAETSREEETGRQLGNSLTHAHTNEQQQPTLMIVNW